MKPIIGGLVFVLLAGGVWYVSTSGSTKPATTDGDTSRATEAEVETATEEADLAGVGSFGTLFARGQALQCDFTAEDEAGRTTGTFYTDGERFSTNARHTYEGVTTETQAIYDTDFMYVWGEGPDGEMAVKLPTPDVNEMEGEVGDDSASREFIDLDEQVSYDCQPWRVDQSLFVPPADREFEDLAAMMQEAMQGMPEGFELPEGVALPDGFAMPQR
jgi:hypothetical protein